PVARDGRAAGCATRASELKEARLATVDRMRPTAAGLAWLGLLAAMSTATAHAEGWTVEKVTTNLEVVSLSESELAERKIKTIALGNLELPTGQIVATDPLVQPDRHALARGVAPGRYPVTLYDAHGRIALAALRLRPGKPAKWEIATL